MRSKKIVAGFISLSIALLASPASAAGPVVPLGGNVIPSSTGPAVPASNLSANHCGYQVPDGAIVRSDGSVVDVTGKALSARVVCSYADVANGSSHGAASNVQASAQIASAATIQAPNNFTIQEVFQQNPFSGGGWYSYTSTIPVPIAANAQPATFRWYAGVFGNATTAGTAVIAGTLQWLNGAYTAYGMIEPALGNGSPVYTTQLSVSPGDVLVVTVQETQTIDTWNVTVTDQSSSVSHSMSVGWGPAMSWVVDVMDASEGGGAPIQSCSELPYFTDVHFGSPRLVSESSRWNPGSVQAFNPSYYNVATLDGQPSCNWSDFVQADNGNQSGFSDLIFNCAPGTCNGSRCGPVQQACTNDMVNCGGCPAGQICSQSICGTSCTPIDCGTQGVSCGSVSDGCGNTLDCGTCVGTRSACISGSCQCTPATCASVGATCGTVDNGCGGTMTCGLACPKISTSTSIPALPPFTVAGLALLVCGLGVFLGQRKDLRS
jgi:hypothetical protein